MKWLKRRLQRWLEIDTTIGKPGFSSIYHKDKPVFPEGSHFHEKLAEATPMTFNERVTMDDHLQNINKEVNIRLENSEVLKDRILKSEKWRNLTEQGEPTISWNGVVYPLDSPEGREIEARLNGEPIKKGYDKS